MKYSGRGDNKSRTSNSTGISARFHPPPEAFQTYAVIFHDVENSTDETTADTLHWTAFNIPGSAKGLPEGLGSGDLPDGTRIAPASRRGGNSGFFGPGAGPGPIHHYVSSSMLGHQARSAGQHHAWDLLKAMDGHVNGKAAWFGRFHTPTPAK